MKCGLLGGKLGHSYSPEIHNALADYEYALYEKKPEELEEFLKYGDFSGLNVTIPYKKAVIPYLSELSPTAARLGAVNTIVRRSDGSLIGHNTDYFGFRTMAQHSGLDLAGKKSLVLGSGGASNTAVAVLRELGSEVIVVSRGGENNYENLHLHQDAAVIVNATPVGMYPNNGNSPVDLSLFPNLEGALDLIFNPARTKFLLDAEKQGIVAMNGLLMLVAQAKESAEWFTGQTIDDRLIDRIYAELNRKMQNIVLIGMPGCGKSTIGRALANRLNRQFVDADEEIVKTAGMPIPEIFVQQGEQGFRALETEILKTLGKYSALVIATGGGCITRPENYPLLHQNGQIFWLQREISLLPTEGRPLSQANKLSDLFAVRRPLYETFSDYVIDSNGTVDETIKQILSKLEEPR